MKIIKTLKVIVAPIVLTGTLLAPGSALAAQPSTHLEDRNMKEVVKRYLQTPNNPKLKTPLTSPIQSKPFAAHSLNPMNDDYLYEIEPNDYMDTPNSLPLNRYVVGTFDSVYDLDFYFIELKNKTNDLIIASAGDEYSSIQPISLLFDVNGNPLYPIDGMEDDIDNVRAYAFSLPAGSYIAGVMNLTDDADPSTPYVFTAALQNQPKPDTTAPAAPKVNAVDDNDYSITGSAEANSNIAAVINGKTAYRGKADSKGKFKLPIKTTKAGTVISFTASDASKNTSKVTKVTVLDRTAPPLKVNNITTKTKVVTGYSESGASITVKRGSTVIGKATADKKRYFKASIKPQKKGTQLTVITTDKYKNSRSVKIKVK
ncbi:hypothetical protein GKZ89_15755 [Bacillus mangrovi]|uniref:Bacterial Ig domain-containing protein n=1 Tax=Metabacillus mangrovi TaxID=1491830 RepID=A0A7X2S736_9BACI|nr:Ig-like domain-containing protein [Metabacillus mangrovi]MTH54857.1 hypothetical protein [Metabacillus mangrovi]